MTLVAIGAGGTAGHVVPALLAAEALVEGGLDPAELLFVGGHGLEATMVPAAGFRLMSLRVLRARRPLWHPANLVVGAVMAAALARAATLMVRKGVRAVLSIGGYAALPVALAAGLTRRRLVLFEPNARAGLANRLCARWAAKVAVPFPPFGEAFGERAVTVGLLVRAEMWAVKDRLEARRALELPEDRVVVGVFGGSQGARRLNMALLDSYDWWRGRGDLAVFQVTGPALIEEVDQRLDGLRRAGDELMWVTVPYQTDMASFYAACDLVVCRAGYSSLAEVLVTGTPAVLVPGAYAEGHQEANAAVAGDAGAAVVVRDGAATAIRLRAEIDDLVGAPSRREAMARAGRAMAGEPGAAGAKLAQLVLEGIL